MSFWITFSHVLIQQKIKVERKHLPIFVTTFLFFVCCFLVFCGAFAKHGQRKGSNSPSTCCLRHNRARGGHGAYSNSRHSRIAIVARSELSLPCVQAATASHCPLRCTTTPKQPSCCLPFVRRAGWWNTVRVSTLQFASIVTRLYSATPSRTGSDKGVRTPGAPCVRLRPASSQRSVNDTSGAAGALSLPTHNPPVAAVKLTLDEEKESIDRLYNVSVRHHASTRQKLKDRYLFHWAPTPSEQTKKELDAQIAQKFYTSEPDRQKKRREDLLAKYVGRQSRKCRSGSR